MSGPKRLLHVKRRGRLVRVFDPAIPGPLLNWGSAAVAGSLEGGHCLFQLIDAGQGSLECRINTGSIGRVISNQFRQAVQCRRVGVREQTCDLLREIVFDLLRARSRWQLCLRGSGSAAG